MNKERLQARNKNMLNQTRIEKITYSGWAMAIITLVYLMVFFNFSTWKKEVVLEWDAWEYYLYLPATFVYHNYDLDFAREQLEFLGSGFNYSYVGPLGKTVVRMSMGLALLETPFFLMGHVVANLTGYEANGFSAPYYFFLLLGTLIYAFIGNWYLRKILRLYFTDTTTAICLLLVNWGTNLFYFVTSEALVTHVPSYMLFALFLYGTIQWHKSPGVKNSFALGVLFGFISLIRPTNSVVALIFVLWGVTNASELIHRMNLFLKTIRLLLLLLVGIALVWFPQLLYWKVQTGQWYYYTYGFLGKFYFNQPHFWDALFSYRKGWLLYTPIMLLALAGIFFLRRQLKDAWFAVLIFVPVNFYIVSSFWCWWYGAGFGLRPMIDSYPLMALLLGATLTKLTDYQKLKKMMFYLLVVLVVVNQIQAYQSRKNILHFDSVTREYYRAMFLRIRNDATKTHLLQAPDYHKALKGEEDY